MNRKGFTLIELLGTLAVLSIVIVITIVGLNGVFDGAKDKTEDVFVGTIKDAMEMYLSDDARKLNGFEDTGCVVNKSYGNRKVYKKEVNFEDVIEKGTLMQSELINPANEEVPCANAENIKVTIYKDEDFVYYYSVDVNSFVCLTENTTKINNLPEGFGCE